MMGNVVIRSSCLLLTFLLKVVLSSDWSVRLPPGPICAVVGSSVVLPCSYDYPQSSSHGEGDGQQSVPQKALHGGVQQTYRVLSEIWCLEEGQCVTPRYVFHSAGIFPEPAYQGRVQYLGGEPGSRNCSLQISDLRTADSGTYVFYLITNHTTEKMPEQPGVQLIVADSPSDVAVAISPCGDITEGVSIRLSCCSPAANPEGGYRWFRGSSPALGHDGQVWGVANVTVADSDLYYCQLEREGGVLNSTSVDVKVEYPPRSMSVSVSPEGELPLGGAVTLTCSSDASPPVHTYDWYQGTGCLRGPRDAAPGGTGRKHTIAAFNTDHRSFCCVATNKHGSDQLTLTLGDTERSEVKGQRLATLGITVAVLLAVIGTTACIVNRRKLSNMSSRQSYILTPTANTAP